MAIDRKKFLGRAVVVLLLVGMGFAMVPFFGSWNPNARSEAARPRLKLPEMEPGTYVLLPSPAVSGSMRMQAFVMVYRQKAGGYKVWQLPVNDRMVVMPDLFWSRWGGLCKDFGPTLVDGIVDESQPIKCHDKEMQGHWGEKYWLWDINGRNLSPESALFMEDMEEFPGIVEGTDFVIGKKSK